MISCGELASSVGAWPLVEGRAACGWSAAPLGRGATRRPYLSIHTRMLMRVPGFGGALPRVRTTTEAPRLATLNAVCAALTDVTVPRMRTCHARAETRSVRAVYPAAAGPRAAM